MTVESCGEKTIEMMLAEATGRHDALIVVTIGVTHNVGPLPFLNSTCYQLSGTQVDFQRNVAAAAANAAGAEVEASVVASRPPDAALRVLDRVYRAIGVNTPTDPDTIQVDGNAVLAYLKRGTSPDDVVEAAKLGAKARGKKAAVADILAAGFDLLGTLPTQEAFEDDE